MTIEFILTEKKLGFYNNQGEFMVEPGAFDEMVGTNSVDGLKGSFVNQLNGLIDYPIINL